jgi:hypothetical protein
MELSKGHQAWNLSRATKQWYLLLATKLRSFFTSFLLLFFQKGKFESLRFSFPEIIFNSNLENTCSHNLVKKEKND